LTDNVTTRRAGPFAGLEEFVTENVPLAPYTCFRLGGPARWLITPRNEEELRQTALRCAENDVPMYVLGLGANILVADSGIGGAVFRLGNDYWREIRLEGDRLRARAGMDMQKLVLKCVRQGLAGIECLAGIPGTIGGGIRMNAGGRFGDIGAAVTGVTVMDRHGQIAQREKEDLRFDYRRSNICAPFIVEATLQLEQDDPDQVLYRTRQIWIYKRNTQPLSARSAGCVFKNPPGCDLSAGALIDRAGLKGMRLGGAEVSTRHANFIVANNGCTATDVLNLIDLVRNRIYQRDGILLENEVQIWP